MTTNLQRKITAFVSLPLIVLLGSLLVVLIASKLLEVPVNPSVETALLVVFLLILAVASVRAVVPLLNSRERNG